MNSVVLGRLERVEEWESLFFKGSADRRRCSSPFYLLYSITLHGWRHRNTLISLFLLLLIKEGVELKRNKHMPWPLDTLILS